MAHVVGVAEHHGLDELLHRTDSDVSGRPASNAVHALLSSDGLSAGRKQLTRPHWSLALHFQSVHAVFATRLLPSRKVHSPVSHRSQPHRSPGRKRGGVSKTLK